MALEDTYGRVDAMWASGSRGAHSAWGAAKDWGWAAKKQAGSMGGPLGSSIRDNAWAAKKQVGSMPWGNIGKGAAAAAAIGGAGYEYMNYRRNHPSSGRRSGYYNGN